MNWTWKNTIATIILAIATFYGILRYLEWQDQKEWGKEKQEKQEEQKQIKVSPGVPLPAPGANGEVVAEMPITKNEDLENKTAQELYEQFKPLPPASSDGSVVQQKQSETKKTETLIPKPLPPPSF